MKESYSTSVLVGDLLRGPLWTQAPELPLHLNVKLCDLRPRFLAKCQVGRGRRAISRNGRVLLATDRPLVELIDQLVRLRIQVWHRAILDGDVPAPYGLLLAVRPASSCIAGGAYASQLTASPGALCELAIQLGGGKVLELSQCYK